MRNSILFLILLAMLNCKAQEQFDVQGHRGARGLLPENSIPGFLKAIDLGVTTLELDVVISKDKQVVVSHEPYMNHDICTAPNGNIITPENEKSFNLFAMDYASIKSFDCGSKGNPRFKEQAAENTYKPLLSEVIKLAEQRSDDILYNIEIKSDSTYDGIYSPAVSEFVALVIDVIVEKGIINKTTLQSFDLRALEEIHNTDSTITTALLVDGSEGIRQKINELSFKPSIISPYFKLLDSSLVKELKSEGYRIIPWTINDIKDMKDVLAMNVDGIITDYPDRLLQLIPRK